MHWNMKNKALYTIPIVCIHAYYELFKKNMILLNFYASFQN